MDLPNELVELILDKVKKKSRLLTICKLWYGIITRHATYRDLMKLRRLTNKIGVDIVGRICNNAMYKQLDSKLASINNINGFKWIGYNAHNSSLGFTITYYKEIIEKNKVSSILWDWLKPSSPQFKCFEIKAEVSRSKIHINCRAEHEVVASMIYKLSDYSLLTSDISSYDEEVIDAYKMFIERLFSMNVFKIIL